MQFYLSGISHPWKIFCNPSHLDHGVLIVGYGMKGTEPWGNKGYYLVYRGDGTCGLNQMCTSAQMKQSRSRRYQRQTVARVLEWRRAPHELAAA
uniref:Pept_C1 domain-containing protein n=1 Tax=Macrostomum lignano TaxID=282301 RepID=A0A1I8JPQ9_9PLAT